MEDRKYQLKIKLDLPDDAAAIYNKLQERWENEGGSTTDESKMISLPEIQLPLKTGDYFQVISGSIDLIGNEIIYIADIRKVDIQ